MAEIHPTTHCGKIPPLVVRTKLGRSLPPKTGRQKSQVLIISGHPAKKGDQPAAVLVTTDRRQPRRDVVRGRDIGAGRIRDKIARPDKATVIDKILVGIPRHSTKIKIVELMLVGQHILIQLVRPYV